MWVIDSSLLRSSSFLALSLTPKLGTFTNSRRIYMTTKKKVTSVVGQQTKAGYVSTEFETPDVPDYVLVELRYESPVAFSASKFSAPAAAAPQADTLNNVLAKYDIAALRSHFGMKPAEVKKRTAIAATLPSEPDPEKFAGKGMDTEFIQSGFVQVVPKKSGDVKKIATELNRKNAVWKAFVAPRPVPAMPSGS